jgi:hypothetical protein
MEVYAKGGFTVGLTAQKITDYWNRVTVNRSKQQRWSAIALFHHASRSKIRIDRRCEGFDTT